MLSVVMTIRVMVSHLTTFECQSHESFSHFKPAGATKTERHLITSAAAGF